MIEKFDFAIGATAFAFQDAISESGRFWIRYRNKGYARCQVTWQGSGFSKWSRDLKHFPRNVHGREVEHALTDPIKVQLLIAGLFGIHSAYIITLTVTCTDVRRVGTSIWKWLLELIHDYVVYCLYTIISTRYYGCDHVTCCATSDSKFRHAIKCSKRGHVVVIEQ